MISFDFLQRSRCITGYYRVMQTRNTNSITGIACAQSTSLLCVPTYTASFGVRDGVIIESRTNTIERGRRADVLADETAFLRPFLNEGVKNANNEHYFLRSKVGLRGKSQTRSRS